MAGALFTTLGLTAVVLAVLYQVYLSPFLAVLGVFRTPQTFGLDSSTCKRIPELQACEKIVLHQPTGLLYLACSDLNSRLQWSPAVDLFHTSRESNDDYVATYDPVTSKISRLNLSNFKKEISVHGMDVVPSEANADELYVYMVNHRSPPAGQDPKVVGADSVIEIFKTKVGSDQLTHITTVSHPIIMTPNDVAGQADGKSFFVTNDHSSKVGFTRVLDMFRSTTTVGYCHVDQGCKVAASKLLTSNGIARALNDTLYVASGLGGKVTVFEKQADNTLLLTDVIPIGQALDNLSLDSNGHLWVAAFPKAFDIIEQITKNTSHPSPVAAFRVSVNTGPNSFYGEKYKVEKVFEDSGTIVSGSTSVAYDAERKLLFMSGTSFMAFAGVASR
ncbi:hypothetical protein D9757_000655 [Collybiopsis confluens]|uniref:SMP-30/Gluconolactonase/LRE-like region domain-containing protein n=1 Tax=Collybiopsis confluens TaxID=2823264 RepID=A0A8H5I2A9_9AGAR|nr:hypothetical protein D9757_000655 [Collybiopsis confluens]